VDCRWRSRRRVFVLNLNFAYPLSVVGCRLSGIGVDCRLYLPVLVPNCRGVGFLVLVVGCHSVFPLSVPISAHVSLSPDTTTSLLHRG
jgi:hypothetical protein